MKNDVHLGQDAPGALADSAGEHPGEESADDLLRIDQVSEQTGLTKRTLRYYEEIGLLAPPLRTEGNYRLYSLSDVDHLMRIKRMRDLLGASLAEIKEMVAAEEQRESTRTHYRQTSDPQARLGLLDDAARLARRQLDLVEEKMAGLEEMRSALQARLQKYEEHRAELEARLREDQSSGQGTR